MGTKRRLLAKVLVAAVLGVVAVAPAATPAQATPCLTPTYLYGWKLPPIYYVCEYGYTQQVYDGRMHVFVVGTGGNQIWHTWQTYVGGPYNSSWVGLGGVGMSAVGTTTGTTNGRQWINISVIGTDGNYWCKIYNRWYGGAWWPSQYDWAFGSVCW